MISVATHQPQFLAWAGYYHKILTTDLFIYMIGSQYTVRNYQNRCTLENEWLSIPLKKAPQHVPLNRRYPVPNWNAKDGKLVRSIQQYIDSRKCRHKDRVRYVLSEILRFEGYENLAQINIALDTAVITQICTDAYIPPHKWPNPILVGNAPRGDSKTLRLVNLIDSVRNGEDVVSCIGTGASNGYYNQDEIPDWIVRTEVQRLMDPTLMRDSILHILGGVEDPYSYILEGLTWVT